MTLSVIIPIYNVEDTLERCIRSVTSQRADGMEIILVDDGSTDSSGSMADRYAEEYTNIKCWHKRNGGLSDARNYGIEKATGRYVTFVDSDDELAPDTYPALLETMATNQDIDIMEYQVLQNPGCKDETLFTPGNNIFINSLDWLKYKGTEHCWACNKIFRRGLFEKVRFEKGAKFEDMLLMADILKLNPMIATINKGCYLYHYNANGIAAKDKGDGLASLLKAQLSLVEKLAINTRQPQWHRLYMDMLTAQLYTYRKKEQLYIAPQRLKIFGYATWKDTVKAIALNILGLRNTCRIFRKIH